MSSSSDCRPSLPPPPTPAPTVSSLPRAAAALIWLGAAIQAQRDVGHMHP